MATPMEARYCTASCGTGKLLADPLGLRPELSWAELRDWANTPEMPDVAFAELG